MKESSADATEVGYIDFGDNEEEETKSQKMRVKVCGRYIYNYPSEKAMNRGGWLHFCIIAKDSDLFDAIKLCRSWDEFFELNILAIFQFFPASNWLLWVGDRLRSQMLQLVRYIIQPVPSMSCKLKERCCRASSHIQRSGTQTR